MELGKNSSNYDLSTLEVFDNIHGRKSMLISYKYRTDKYNFYKSIMSAHGYYFFVYKSFSEIYYSREKRLDIKIKSLLFCDKNIF